MHVPPLPHSCYMSRSSNPPRLNYSNYAWGRVQITKLLVVQFLHYLVTSTFLDPNILLSTLLVVIKYYIKFLSLFYV
jgi:hypothetical protein